MGVAYTPGLTVTAWTVLEKVRELPLPGKVLVQVGEQVKASQVILTAELPGELEIVRLSEKLGLPPEEALPCVKVHVGTNIEKKEIIAEHKAFFGFFSVDVESPCSGNIEFLTEANAHLGIRRPATQFELQAYVDGEILSVEAGKAVSIRAKGAQIQGIFGVGGERHGTIVVLPQAIDTQIQTSHIDAIAERVPRAILVGGSSFHIDAIRRAAELQASAILTGSIDSVTLAQYVGYEIGVSITGDEEVPLTLIVTEGFGELSLSPRILALAKRLEGREGSVSGATQVRAGALRPELFVSLPSPLESQTSGSPIATKNTLEVGSRVRVIRVPYFGQFGEVTSLPHEPQAMPCGSVVRVLEAKLENGEVVTVPRANVELSE